MFLYSCLSCPAWKAQFAVLYCHLWPGWLYIIL